MFFIGANPTADPIPGILPCPLNRSGNLKLICGNNDISGYNNDIFVNNNDISVNNNISSVLFSSFAILVKLSMISAGELWLKGVEHQR